MLPLNVFFSFFFITILLLRNELSSLTLLLGQPCFQFDESLSEKRQGHVEDVLAD